MSPHVVNVQAHGAELRVAVHASRTQTLDSRGVVLHFGHACSTMSFWLAAEDARAIAHAITLAADEAYSRSQEEAEA